MGRKRNRNRNRNKTTQNANKQIMSNVTEIDYDKLAQAIVKAHQTIKENEEKERKKQKELDQIEWNKLIGYTENNEKIFFKRVRHNFRNMCNRLKFLIRYNSDKYQKDNMIFNIIGILTEDVLGIMEIGCIAVAVVIIIGYICNCIFDYQSGLAIFLYIILLIDSIVFMVFGILCRVAKKQVEFLKEKDQLISIFSAMTCFVAMILAIISLIITAVKP